MHCSPSYDAPPRNPDCVAPPPETQLAQNGQAQRNGANMRLLERRSLNHCIPRQSHGTRECQIIGFRSITKVSNLMVKLIVVIPAFAGMTKKYTL